MRADGTDRVLSGNSYSCSPHNCNPYSCSPHNCNPYNCGPYNCNPYSCSPYRCSRILIANIARVLTWVTTSFVRLEQLQLLVLLV